MRMMHMQMALEDGERVDILRAFQMTAARLADKSTWPDWVQEAAAKPKDELFALFEEDGKLRMVNEDGAHTVPAEAYLVQQTTAKAIWFCDAEAFELKHERVWIPRNLPLAE